MVGKGISMQISTSLPISMSTTSTTMILKPVTKGIFIGSTVGGLSSKPPLSSQVNGDRGKGIVKDILEEVKRRI